MLNISNIHKSHSIYKILFGHTDTDIYTPYLQLYLDHYSGKV